MKWQYWIFIIVGVALLIRVLFNEHIPGYQTRGDSVSYFLTRTLVDPWRTPVYPFIMKMPFLMKGMPLPAQLPRETFSGELWSIRVAQAVAGTVTVVLLFFLLIRLKFSANSAGMYSLFIALHPSLLINEFSLVTEAFATLWLVIVLYLTVIQLRWLNLRTTLLLALLCIVGVFLRPSYILFPLVVLGVLVWHHKSRLVLALSVSVLCIYATIILLYVQGNYVTHSYAGISRIADVNMLGKIFLYRLPVDNIPRSEIGDRVATYMKESSDPSPWEVYRRYPDLYSDEFATPMSTFTRAVVRENFVVYLIGATRELPGAIMDIAHVEPIIYKTERFASVFLVLSHIYRWTQGLHFMLLLAVPLFMLDLWRKQTIETSAAVLFALTGMYHIVFGVYAGYEEYARHLSVAQPILYVVSLWFVAGRIKK